MTAAQFLGTCMQAIERRVALAAAKEAIRSERAFWLPRLVEWRAQCDPAAPYALLVLDHFDQEITRLRRLLGIAQPADDKRAATRARVQRHRDRAKTEAWEQALQHSPERPDGM